MKIVLLVLLSLIVCGCASVRPGSPMNLTIIEQDHEIGPKPGESHTVPATMEVKPEGSFCVPLRGEEQDESVWVLGKSFNSMPTGCI